MDGTWGVYSCGLAGYVVKVNDDCESVTWYFDDGSGKDAKKHQSKIYHSVSGRPYFRARGLPIYLDECLRMTA